MSARPALTRAAEAARNAHQPFGITVTTTPRFEGDKRNFVQTFLIAGNSYNKTISSEVLTV